MLHVPSIEQFNLLLKRVELLETELIEKQNSPLLLEWVSREQASKILRKSPATVTEMGKKGLIEYRKEQRKIEFALDSIRKYLERTHVKKETVKQRVYDTVR